jgi:hypothetical protein
MTRTVAGRDPVALARGIAYGRIAIGLALVAAPSLWSRVVAGTPPRQDALAAARIAGARDLGMGIGTALAARRGTPAELRRWVDASALADGIDALTFLRSTSFPLLPRLAALTAVTSATVAGVLVRRALPRG